MNADDFGTVKLYSESTSGSAKVSQTEPFIEVYPNPAADHVNITVNAAVRKFEVADLTGKIKSVFLLQGQEKYRIPVSHLSQGIYLTRFTATDNTVYVGKLLIL
jgi:hypothetical protein